MNKYIIVDTNTNTQVLDRDFLSKNLAYIYMIALNSRGRKLEVREVKNND